MCILSSLFRLRADVSSLAGRHISPHFRGYHRLGKVLVHEYPTSTCCSTRSCPSCEICRAREGKSKDKGEGPTAIRAHQPSRQERLGPGSSRIDTSILLPASHPIFTPSLNHLHTAKIQRYPVLPATQRVTIPLPDFVTRRFRTTSADPTTHASFIPIHVAAACDGIFDLHRVSAISCTKISALCVVSASGIGIGQLEQVMEQDPDGVRVDVCVLERQEYYHLPDLHAQVLRRCVQEEEAFIWAKFVQRRGL